MSFKSDLLDFIDEYTNFEIVVPGPAGGSISYDGLEVPYKLGAKNTPQAIKETVANDPDNNDPSTGLLKDIEYLQEYMDTHKSTCGIDCSGFAYYTLNEASNGAVYDQFGVSYSYGVSASTLTNTSNGTQKTKAKDIVPGCTIRFDNGGHVLVVYDVVKNSSRIVTRIRYAHSNGSMGPHKGYISIGDQNQDLDGSSQTWHDDAYTSSTAKSLYNHTILLDSLE